MVGAPGTTGALGRVRAALLLLGQPFAGSPVTGILDTSLEPVLWIGHPTGRPCGAELPLPVGSSGGWGSSSSSAFLGASPRVTVITAEKCHPDLGPQGATRPGGVSSRFWGSETMGVSSARAIVFRWVPGWLEPSARSAECVPSELPCHPLGGDADLYAGYHLQWLISRFLSEWKLSPPLVPKPPSNLEFW